MYIRKIIKNKNKKRYFVEDVVIELVRGAYDSVLFFQFGQPKEPILKEYGEKEFLCSLGDIVV